MTKSNGSAKRGRRGIVLLTALATACGAVFIGSAGTASAGNLITCGGKITPINKKKPGTDAQVTVQCNEDIRGFGVVSTHKLTGVPTSPTVFKGNDAVSFAPGAFACNGSTPGFGFGCGTTNRLITPPTDALSNRCGTVVLLSGTSGASNQVQQVQGPCTNRIAAGNTSVSTIKFAKNPCLTDPKVFVVSGSEPIIEENRPASDKPEVNIINKTMGDYTSQPFALKLQGWTEGKCPKAKGDKGGSGVSGKVIPPNPNGCSGTITPVHKKKPNERAQFNVQCTTDIRAFSIITTKFIDEVAGEPVVFKGLDTVAAETAIFQCEGTAPGLGFGCGIPNRLTAPAGTPSNRCGTVTTTGTEGTTTATQKVENACTLKMSAGNTGVSEFSFAKSPCEAKPRAFVVAGNEPILEETKPASDDPAVNIVNKTMGDFVSQPFPIKVQGWTKGKCAPALKALAKAEAKAEEKAGEKGSKKS